MRWNARLTREIYRLREDGHVSHGSMSARAYTSYYTQNMLHTTRGLRTVLSRSPGACLRVCPCAACRHQALRHRDLELLGQRLSSRRVRPAARASQLPAQRRVLRGGRSRVWGHPVLQPAGVSQVLGHSPVHEARSGVVRMCPLCRQHGAAHSLSELAEAHHAAEHELQGPDHRELQLPVHFHDAQRAITRGGSGMAKKKVKKRSATKSKRKPGAKNLKAKSMKASSAARVRGGASERQAAGRELQGSRARGVQGPRRRVHQGSVQDQLIIDSARRGPGPGRRGAPDTRCAVPTWASAFRAVCTRSSSIPALTSAPGRLGARHRCVRSGRLPDSCVPARLRARHPVRPTARSDRAESGFATCGEPGRPCGTRLALTPRGSDEAQPSGGGSHEQAERRTTRGEGDGAEAAHDARSPGEQGPASDWWAAAGGPALAAAGGARQSIRRPRTGIPSTVLPSSRTEGGSHAQAERRTSRIEGSSRTRSATG